MNMDGRNPIAWKERLCRFYLDMMVKTGDEELVRNSELMESELRRMVADGYADGIDGLVGEAIDMLAEKGIVDTADDGSERKKSDDPKIEAMSDVVVHMIRMMESTGDPELLRHVWDMTRERWYAVARGDMATLVDLNAEATIRLHRAGWLDFGVDG